MTRHLLAVVFQKLQELFLDEQKWLSQNCIVAVAGGLSDGTSGLQEDSSFAAFRQEVERFADVIFASSPKQRDFWLGKTPAADRKTIEEKYKALKPCMHGSDAHRVESVGAPAEKRYCWLKGDLAFETMRQAVLEPEYRVSIGETPPPGPSPSEMIRHVELQDAPFIATPELPVNPGLVTIIGARGSGKTALMEFLVAAANALTSAASDSSFLQRAGNLLGDAKVEITWGDGEGSSVELHNPFGWFSDETDSPRVCYLSQQFVERLCSSSGLATELRREMERVVFEATDQADRMQCDSFAELSGLLLAPPAETRADLEESIRQIGGSILKEEQLQEQLPAQEASIKGQKEQIEKLQKEMKEILPKDKEAHAKKLVELENAFNQAETKVESLRLRRKHLTDLLADAQQTIQSREPNRFEDMKRRFAGAGLSAAEWEEFRMFFKGNVQQVIQSAVKTLDETIRSVIEGEAGKPVDPGKTPPANLPLNKVRELRDASKAAAGIDAAKQKKYEELQRAIAQMESAVRKLETEHVNAKGAADRRKQLQQRRRAEYIEVFKTFAEEEQALENLYQPLRKRLAEAQGTLSKLTFVVEREVKVDAWVKQGEDLLDLRRESRFRGRGALREYVVQYLLGNWSTGGPDEVAEAIDKFRAEFQDDFRKALPEFDTTQERRARAMEIGAWLYSTGHIKVQYGITYEGTPMSGSPQERGNRFAPAVSCGRHARPTTAIYRPT